MVKKKNKSLPDEKALMEMTMNALADVLGREPTKQEILRAHAGFRRMAFVMMEHLEHQDKNEKQQRKKES